MLQEEKLTAAAGEFDWASVRAEFPATETYAYLNSAGAGPLSRRVAGAAGQLYREASESGDRLWEVWLARREQARADVARLINAEPDEIAFTTNTSSGMNLIVDALEGAGDVVSCELEFPTSTIPWMYRGVGVRLLKAVEGELRTEDLLAAAGEGEGVICLSHVQYSNGLRAPLEEIGASKGRRTFVVNASQSAGAFRIDVKRMRIDALCSAGHKWMLAGYGAGFVYLSRELQRRTRPRAVSWMSNVDPFAMRNDSYDLRGDAAARAETGCPHFAGIFALGEAARHLLEIGPERIERRVLALNRHLTESLAAAGWRVLSPLRDEAARSAETLVASEDPARTFKHLSRRKVAVSIKPEGFRAATHFFNDEEDIARLVSALDEFRGAA
ncbi:MAG: aminotransferase class V-fold PLP-dependent enzyme [Acidobacteriota bacterium]|nr:aminotransferase class V-fold PLP-dependent enzyme [Acidobacteriota bacterium]MDQ5836886.1 aminotransferase class V-fold PLP-dependent enzyme [Acidobacteriota bacterium]